MAWGWPATVVTCAAERTVKLLQSPLSSLPAGLAAEPDTGEEALAEFAGAAQAIAAEARMLAHPVSFEVVYRFHPRSDGLLVDARVAVPRKRGLTAQMLRSATVALLNAGALGAALRRLERCVSPALEPELVAA